jgi:glycine/D-amino acid oxidase-like deaminating enzyme
LLSCGETDPAPLPETAADVTTSPEAIAQLHRETIAICPTTFEGAETIAEQACFIPVSEEDKKPWIGKLRGVNGVYIGAGHSCWGITQGPGTGKVLAEMVLEGDAKSANISKLKPIR